LLTGTGLGAVTVKATNTASGVMGTEVVTVTAAQTTDIVTETFVAAAAGGFGSTATINVTNLVNYAGATQYEVLVGGVVVSSKAAINTSTTVYPAQKSGTAAQVEFFNAAGTQVGPTANVTLQ